MRFFDKYTGFIRRLKLVYVLNNIWNIKHLKNNKALYDKLSVHRGIWRSISSKHFDKLPGSSELAAPANADWEKNGFLHLKGHYSSDFVEEINDALDNAIAKKEIDFNYTQKKILFAYEKVEILKKVINNQRLKEILESLTQEKIVPFQSINFVQGSEQRAHSDSVHMATYPLGGLIAIWVALEDVDENNGTLFYYPGSHKLPYASNKMVGNKTGWLFSENPNRNYEDYLENEMAKSNLKKEVFVAKKGDVLVWHANLVHGGLPHLDKTRTRKSMVVHYFVKDRVCYHELSQRPALIKEIK